MRVLIVHEPFGDYAKGHIIKDPEEHAALAESGKAAHCTPTDIDESFFADDAPAPKAKPKSAA